jgi:hypothetical protein
MNQSVRWIKFTLVGALLVTLTGCFGVVGPGYYGPGYFDDYGPDVTIFGGYYGRDHHDRDYSHRGAASRSVVSHGGHFSGGGHH